MDDWLVRVNESSFEGEVLERNTPDERLPVRYDVAEEVVRVVFNTLQAPPDTPVPCR